MVQTACTYANKNNPLASKNDYSEAHAGYIIAPSQSQTLTQPEPNTCKWCIRSLEYLNTIGRLGGGASPPGDDDVCHLEEVSGWRRWWPSSTRCLLKLLHWIAWWRSQGPKCAQPGKGEMAACLRIRFFSPCHRKSCAWTWFWQAQDAGAESFGWTAAFCGTFGR